MSIRERIQRYKTEGGAAGLTRVEVLVPPDGRHHILALAQRLRGEHRRAKALRSVNAEAVNDRAKLMMHRLLARRIASEPEIIDQAREMISKARTSGKPQAYGDEWRALLALELAELRTVITRRSPEMDRLRIQSPLALVTGIRDPNLRKRLWRKARQGLALRAVS
ncbi:MAG: hypothetical protein QGH73_01025 [Rhodospirillales bacterium]|jgi:hypothetical protein|nr:hypothetical protein [Rhodospirillales bacterium]